MKLENLQCKSFLNESSSATRMNSHQTIARLFAPQGKYPWLDPVMLQSRQMSLIYHCGLHTWVPAVLSCIEATERHAQYEEM